MHTLEIDKKPIWEMKATLKTIAEEIRTLKPMRKPRNNPNRISVSSRLEELRYNYRHMHIAYCEIRGKRYEQIEPKVRDHNSASRSRIDEYKGQYYIPQVKNVQAVCVSQI